MATKPTTSKRYRLRLNPDVEKALRHAAVHHDMSPGVLISEILSQYLRAMGWLDDDLTELDQ